MVERMVNDHNDDTAPVTPAVSNKRRKVQDKEAQDPDDTLGFFKDVVHSLKKPKTSKAPGGTGYAGNITEDVGNFINEKITLTEALYIAQWPDKGAC